MIMAIGFDLHRHLRFLFVVSSIAQCITKTSIDISRAYTI